MSRHRKKGSLTAARSSAGAAGIKVWAFRLSCLSLGPALLLLLLEAALRLCDFGYSPSFLVPAVVQGKRVFVQNDRFGWRFFGPSHARTPFPFLISRSKSADTVRVFVFGESAAFGDPQPEFGLPRLLQAVLTLRYPGTHFEVINAAMTGINSHVILPIAQDCARAQGDIWVVYMGNNEVVGPFGAGTVFGPQSPSLRLIRASLALKATRIGELLEAIIQKLHPPLSDQNEWGGMLMFLQHQVTRDDPRMKTVYNHFEHNLSDLLKLSQARGAAVVLGTVAVNLKDSAPFASIPRTTPSAVNPSGWRELFQRGLEEQKAGRHPQAIDFFRQAEQLDDSTAELQFSIAKSYVALGRTNEAQTKFALARDLDALRFRCDSGLNTIIRQVASGQKSGRILLADPEVTFAQQSPDGVPGADFFYEHVHLTFEGNYLLARTFADQVTKLLPKSVRHRGQSQAWPSLQDCARQLGWTDYQRLQAIDEVLGRLSDPPFTAQLDHAENVQRLSQLSIQLRPKAEANAKEAAAICQAALKTTPDDPVLYQQLAITLGATGDWNNAAAAARRMSELLPNSPTSWMLLGDAHSKGQHFEEAIAAFKQAFELDPKNFWALQGLGLAYEKLGRRDDAIREYQHAVQLKPRLGPVWLALGQLREQQGQKEEAEKDYQLALTNRVHRVKELSLLAQFCQNKKWFEAAATNYVDAIKMSPADFLLHLKAGQCFAALGRHSDAQQHFSEALSLNPDSGPAHFLLGVELGRQGKGPEATTHFSEAVRLMPAVVEARVNLGIALLDQGRRDEALEQFREVLKQSPTNAVALKYAKTLGSKPD